MRGDDDHGGSDDSKEPALVQQQQQRRQRQLCTVYLYVPNLIGYARLITTAVAFWFALKAQPAWFVGLYLARYAGRGKKDRGTWPPFDFDIIILAFWFMWRESRTIRTYAGTSIT